MAPADQFEMLDKVRESLKDGPYACSALVKLSGGTANFVYRGTLAKPLKDGTRTIVIKHTEPFSASNTNFELPVIRCDYEQTILQALQELQPISHSAITIETPKIYNFSTLTNTQIYSDLPDSADLKTYALTHTLTEAQCSRLGHALGLWAMEFHDWAAAPDQQKLREIMKGNTTMRELKFTINYGTILKATVANFPSILESRSVFEAVSDQTRKTFDRQDGWLIHGDFWSGKKVFLLSLRAAELTNHSILLKNEPFPGTDQPLKLFVIDWELSHLSDLAFDLGQMFAELLELKLFKEIDAGLWLVEAFMSGYGQLETAMAFRVAIHVGVHLVCWGSRVPGWGSEAQIEKVVRIGRDLVVNAWAKNITFFDSTPLRCLFSKDLKNTSSP